MSRVQHLQCQNDTTEARTTETENEPGECILQMLPLSKAGHILEDYAKIRKKNICICTANLFGKV